MRRTRPRPPSAHAARARLRRHRASTCSMSAAFHALCSSPARADFVYHCLCHGLCTSSLRLVHPISQPELRPACSSRDATPWQVGRNWRAWVCVRVGVSSPPQNESTQTSSSPARNAGRLTYPTVDGNPRQERRTARSISHRNSERNALSLGAADSSERLEGCGSAHTHHTRRTRVRQHR